MKKQIIFSVLFSILFSLGACKKNKITDLELSKQISFSDFENIIDLSGKEMEFDDIIYNPKSIYIIDSLLITNDLHAPSEFHIYNINTLRKIGGYFMQGNGPNEFLTNRMVQSYNSNLWIWDLDRQTLSEYAIANLLDGKGVEPLSRIKLEEESGIPIILSPDTILVNRSFDANHKLSFFDMDGKLSRTFGEYPAHNKESTRHETIQGFSFEYISNYQDRIFLAYTYASIMEVYDIQGRLLRRINGPDNFMPVAKERIRGNVSQVLLKPDESKVNCSELKSVGDEVFVLYSGKSYADYDGESTLILVFDWEGTPLRSYKLDKPIYTFDVDPVKKTIYGVGFSPEINLKVFHY